MQSGTKRHREVTRGLCPQDPPPVSYFFAYTQLLEFVVSLLTLSDREAALTLLTDNILLCVDRPS